MTDRSRGVCLRSRNVRLCVWLVLTRDCDERPVREVVRLFLHLG